MKFLTEEGSGLKKIHNKNVEVYLYSVLWLSNILLQVLKWCRNPFMTTQSAEDFWKAELMKLSLKLTICCYLIAELKFLLLFEKLEYQKQVVLIFCKKIWECWHNRFLGYLVPNKHIVDDKFAKRN